MARGGRGRRSEGAGLGVLLLLALGLAACASTTVASAPTAAPGVCPTVPAAPPACAVPAPRAAPRRPTLGDVRALVLERSNLRLAAEAVREAEARAEVRQAGLSPNPYVLFRKRRVEDLEFFDTGLTEVELAQPFELGGKRRARVAEALAEVSRVSEEVRALTLATLRDAELRFYRVLRLQHDLEQAREEEQATNELEGLAATRFETGKDSRIAALRLEAQAHDARLTVQDLERRHGRACRQLDEALGLAAGTTLGVEGAWASAVLSDLHRGSARARLSRHPRRLAAERAVAAACRGVERADAEAWPDVTVGAEAGHDTRSGEDYVGLLVHVPLPVWNRNEGARAAARAAAIRARRTVQAEALDLEVELDDALLAYEKSERNARGYETQILPTLEQSLELARQAYESGRTSYLDVLDALIALIRARRARLGHLEEQARAAVELRYLMGSDPNFHR